MLSHLEEHIFTILSILGYISLFIILCVIWQGYHFNKIKTRDMKNKKDYQSSMKTED